MSEKNKSMPNIPGNLFVRPDLDGEYWEIFSDHPDWRDFVIASVARRRVPFEITKQLARDFAAAQMMRDALRDVLATGCAAVSLLERGGEKAAQSDKTFQQMLADYKASIERGRAAICAAEGRTPSERIKDGEAGIL